MNIDGLKYFVTVAECGSFSKASELLYITQPALSRHIQRLEDELGAPLFKRSRTEGVTMTELGASCLKDAIRILSYSERLFAKANAHVAGSHGSITIGYNGMERSLLYSLTKYIRQEYPNIKVLLHHECIGDLLQCTLDGTTDIAFMFQGLNYQNAENLHFLPLHNSQMQLLVPKTHPFATRQSIHIEELRTQPIIGWHRNIFPEYYDAFHQLCRAHGFSPNTICEEETHAIFSYVSAGDGVGFVPSFPAHNFSPWHICTIDIKQGDNCPMPNWPLALAWNKNNTNPCIHPVLKLAEQHLVSKCETN